MPSGAKAIAHNIKQRLVDWRNNVPPHVRMFAFRRSHVRTTGGLSQLNGDTLRCFGGVDASATGHFAEMTFAHDDSHTAERTVAFAVIIPFTYGLP